MASPIPPSAALLPIVPATAAALEDVLDLLARSGLPREGLLEHAETVLVARDGDRIVGSVALELYEDGALLRSLAVAPEYRGRRVGEALTRAALDLARRRGAAQVYLLTETAGAFFPRFGFQEIPREEVPAGVRQSVEFTSVCPVSALVMVHRLS